MIRVKLGSQKKQVNEFLGGLFSRNSSTSASKAQMSAKNAREVQEFVKSIDQKLGAQKLKSLGVSLVDLYQSIDDATKVFSGGKGALQSLSSNKTQVVINLLKQDYDDVVKRVEEKKLTPQEANDVVLGIIKIAGTYNSLVPAMMEEGSDELNEAFGMQKKAIRSFIQGLKLFNPDGSLSDKKAADQQPIATAPASGSKNAAQPQQIEMTPEQQSKWEEISPLVIQAIRTGRYQEEADDTTMLNRFKSQFLNMLKKDFSKMSPQQIQQELTNLPTQARAKAKELFMQNKPSSPPPPPKQDDDESAAVQAAITEVPPQTQQAQRATAATTAPQKELSPEEKQDKINTYSKMASRQVQTKLNKMITPADAQKVVQILMNKNYLNEQLTYDSLVDELVKQTGMEKDIIITILDSLQNNFKGELQKLSFDKEREQFSGMGVNESLNENLISRKKDMLFSDDDAKRFKLLAGIP